MRTPERPQARKEWQHPDDHIRYGDDLCTPTAPSRIIDRRRELDRGDRMCGPLLGTELHPLCNPFRIIYAAGQSAGGRVLAARWTNDDVSEQQGLGNGRERFGNHGQILEIGLVLLEEGEDVMPQFRRYSFVLHRLAFLPGRNGVAGLQGNGPTIPEGTGC